MIKVVVALVSIAGGAIFAETGAPAQSSYQATVKKEVYVSPSQDASRDERGLIRRTWDSAVEAAQGAWNAVTGWFGKADKESSVSQNK